MWKAVNCRHCEFLKCGGKPPAPVMSVGEHFQEGRDGAGRRLLRGCGRLLRLGIVGPWVAVGKQHMW